MRHILLLILAVTSLVAAELPFKQPLAFSCDIAFSGGDKGEAGKGRMIVGGPDKTRMDITMGEQSMVMILRKDRQKMIMLMTEQKMAMTMPINPAMMAVQDPTQDPKASFVKTGSETINGVACDRYEWTSGKGEKGTAWIDSKLNVLVRAKPADGKGQLDCTNYQIGAQKADLFEVPAGYQSMGQ